MEGDRSPNFIVSAWRIYTIEDGTEETQGPTIQFIEVNLQIVRRGLFV